MNIALTRESSLYHMCSLCDFYTVSIITSVHKPSTGSESLLIAVHIYPSGVNVQYFKIPMPVIVWLLKEKLRMHLCGSRRSTAGLRMARSH